VKKQSYLLTFAVASVLSVSSNDLSAQLMEETITYGSRIYYAAFSAWTYDWAFGEDTFDRDLEYEDWLEAQNDHAEDCNDLLMIKPAECTTDPGPVSNYVDSFIPMGWALMDGVFAYQALFRPGLLVAAQSYIDSNQDSRTATAVFFNEIKEACLNGGGADIDAPTIWPVSNEIYCLGVAGRLADGMNTDFSVPTGSAGFSLYFSISFDLEFGPWGNKFFKGLNERTQCRAWYNSWNAYEC